jgi:hypothetical protein
VAFDHQAVGEPQYLTDQTVVLVAVGDDDGLDTFIDAFDREAQMWNACEGLGPVVAQGRFAANDATGLRQQSGGHGRSENYVVVKMLEHGFHVMGVPSLDPLTAEDNRVDRDQAVQSQTDMSPLGYWSHTSVALATTPLLLKKILAQLPQCVATCS